jgi:alpha-acetolactate decarboxylase
MLQRLALLATLAATIATATPPLATYGTIGRLLREGDAAPKVVLADVLREPHAHGLGSLSELRGEITILDGEAWLSYPPVRDGDAPKVVASKDSREQAGFLVVTHVTPARWRQMKTSTALSAEGLEAALHALVAKNGLAGADIPFRIDGRFTSLTLAIVDGRKGNRLQTETSVDGTLVGFLAAKDDERFTHAGTRVHVHAVAPARRATGHAQAFTLAPGATVWLPAAP